MSREHRLPSSISLPIPLDSLSETVQDARDLACLNGFLMRTREEPDSSEVITPAPFVLLPASVPKHLFQKGLDIQPHINELYYKVANDYDFLHKTLKSTIGVDEFTAKQWEILEEVRKMGRSKMIHLAMLRSDYMLDRGKGDGLEWSQVEVNTMSASFAGLASQLAKVHRLIIGQLGQVSDVSKIPLNNANSGFAEALHTAWKVYGNPQAAVVILVNNSESNIFDQRLLETSLRDLEPTIKVRRRTMEYVGRHGTLTDDNRLMLSGEEIAVVYYRTGYVPKNLKTDLEWKAKLLAELSKAAVCPSIGWHLAGSKKVQQELARPGVLEKYISDPKVVAAVRSTFTGLYSLALDSEGDEATAKAIENPEKFVMKPQLEGGGNNIYGEDIKTTLLKITGSEERNKYILMDRIIPPSSKNHVVRRGASFTDAADYVSEFGFYGSFVSLNGEIVLNKTSGHQVRSKLDKHDEGGVMVGFSSLNSPFVVE